MKLDNEFSDVQARQGGFVMPPPGGHVFKVLGVSDNPSKAGNDMVTLELDIAQGEFSGAFERFPKKYFQLVNGDNLPYFKGMIEAFAASNDKRKMAQVLNGLDFNPMELEGLLVGGNLREAEYLNNSGEVAVGMEIAYLAPVGDVPKLKPLPLKKLPKDSGARTTSYGGGSGASRPRPEEDDLPF